MRKNILFITSCLLAATTFAEDINTLPKDTTKVIDIEEVVVIASPKETGKLRELPTAVSLLSQKDMQANQITTLKNVSSLVPNFFMPDYGSRLTSAIYIRGIGSRINTPAVGLYVDNIPYIDKSAFDFNFYDIERIDILRGPQGTLYGRNTMGPLRHTNIIILDKYNDKLRLYNNLIHLKSFPPILLEKHYRPTTGNSICSTHPCNYRN